MCYIAANASPDTRGDTTKTAPMDKKNRRNNLAHIRMLIIRIWIAAIDSLASCRSKQITLVPRNDGICNKPEYAALLTTETGCCGGLYGGADALVRHRRRCMRPG